MAGSQFPEGVNLANDQISDFPNRKVYKVYADELPLMICTDGFPVNGNNALKLWNTDTWRELGTANYSSDEDIFSIDLAFSLDTSMLFIAQDSQVTVWDIDDFFIDKPLE